MKIVGIIGGSGFIGSYVTKKFLTETYFTPELTEENYWVRVSATDISKTEKYLHLLSFPNSKNLEIIPLDVSDRTDMLAFVTGCDILVHCGASNQLDFADLQTELFESTLKGTKNLLSIACSTPHLSKLIFVSPVTAHDTGFPLTAGDQPDYPMLSDSGSPSLPDDSYSYNLSKNDSDQIIRRYIAEHPANEIEIVMLFPGLVTGKTLSARPDSSSTGLQFLIKNKIAPNPYMKMLFAQDVALAVVDVNDVAEGIYKTAVIPRLHGKHYLLSGESWRISDISLMLNNQQPLGTANNTGSGKLAMKELSIAFKPAKLSLSEYASISENQFQE